MDYSSINSFTNRDQQCLTFSNNTPVPIATTPVTITSEINIPNKGNLIDINVTGLDITHTYTADLIIDLISPNTTEVTLISRVCGSNDDMNLLFDDEADRDYADIDCPPTDGINSKPFQNLSAFDDENAQGNWTLSVADVANQDGGSLNSWSIEVCYDGVICSDTLVLNQNPIPEDDYLAFKAIISTGNLDSNTDIDFEAGVEILLNAGFEIEEGSSLSAFISQLEGCANK